MKKGQSASFLRSLRRKHKLGEFATTKRPRKSRPARAKSSSRSRGSSALRTRRKRSSQPTASKGFGFFPDIQDSSSMRSESYQKVQSERGTLSPGFSNIAL